LQHEDKIMNLDKNDVIALVGTIVAHLATFLILSFIILKTIMPDEDEGVLVILGNVEFAAGNMAPRGGGATTTVDAVPIPEVTPVRTPPTTSTTRPNREELITQNTEETIALENRRIENERRQREEAERIERERLDAEKRRLAEEQRQREQAIQNQVAGAFGAGNAESGSQGSATTGTGVEGSPFGNSNTGATEGVGGFGGGSFNLGGRSIRGGGLPRPEDRIAEAGTIVINITVDPRGDVIHAEIGRGTNIDNSVMRAGALDAAKRAKFNSIQGTNNQSGSITYRYRTL
jgi:TonB family protein